MRRFFLLLIVTVFCLTSFSQNKFQLSYDQTGKDFNALNAIKRVSDGYIMVGTTGSTTSNLNDLVVMKTDFSMNISWTKSIGTTAFDEKIEYLSKCVVFETDGIVILGNTSQPGTRDFLLTKVDYTGAILWSKSYGFPISASNYNDNASALCKTANGYYLCGYLNIATTGHCLVLKVDNSGVQEWARYFIPQSGVTANLWAGLNLSSNDLVVSGSYGNGASDAYLIKISSLGAILWQKNFTNTNYDNIHDLAEDQNNSLLCSIAHDGYFGGSRGGLLNINLTSGAVNWAKTFDLDNVNDRDGQMVGLLKNPDNTTMIAFIYGNVAAGAYKSDIAIAKLDGVANVVWAKKYGTTDGDAWPKIYPNNGSYLVCAEQANNRYPSDHFYLLGLNSDGKSGCNETDLTPVVTTLTGYSWLDFSSSMNTIIPTVATQSLISSTINMNKNILCVNTGLNDITRLNPAYIIATDRVRNEINIFSSSEIKSVEIISTFGQVLVVSSNQSSIDISSLATGTYIVKVNNDFCRKFVKY